MHRRKRRRSRQRHRRGSRRHSTATALLDALDALDAVDGAVERGLALALGPLEAPVGEAVAAVVEVDTLLGREVGANAAFLAEEVVRDGEVGEVGKHADAVEEISGHYVVGEVELLEVVEPRHAVGNGAGEVVETDVEHLELVEKTDLLRQTA